MLLRRLGRLGRANRLALRPRVVRSGVRFHDDVLSLPPNRGVSLSSGSGSSRLGTAVPALGLSGLGFTIGNWLGEFRGKREGRAEERAKSPVVQGIEAVFGTIAGKVLLGGSVLLGGLLAWKGVSTIKSRPPIRLGVSA